MHIGPFALANHLFVAPMAGVTDRPFRQLCKRLGAGYAVSEMVTSRKDLWNTLKTSRRANHDGEPGPIAVQIAGTEAQMMADANTSPNSVMYKNPTDPRVTKVGRFIRKWSIDEIPQLFNVLIGHMSMVGPRPPLLSEVEVYGAADTRRLLVKPGITGLWQTSGRANLDWDETVRLDLDYVENWNPAMDVFLIIKTIKSVLSRGGAF